MRPMGRLVAWKRYDKGVDYDYPYNYTTIHITESAYGDIHSRLRCGRYVPSTDDEVAEVYFDKDAELNGRRCCATCFGISAEEAEDYELGD